MRWPLPGYKHFKLNSYHFLCRGCEISVELLFWVWFPSQVISYAHSTPWCSHQPCSTRTPPALSLGCAPAHMPVRSLNYRIAKVIHAWMPYIDLNGWTVCLNMFQRSRDTRSSTGWYRRAGRTTPPASTRISRMKYVQGHVSPMNTILEAVIATIDSLKSHQSELCTLSTLNNLNSLHFPLSTRSTLNILNYQDPQL